MLNHLKFSHKILLAASLVVVATFSMFTLYNDYLQRNFIRTNLTNYLGDVGDTTSQYIQSWIAGRLLLLENTAQTVARQDDTPTIGALMAQPALRSTFTNSFFGRSDGEFIVRPEQPLPDDFDPRPRPWYQAAIAANGTTLTEPYVDTGTNQLVITATLPVQRSGQTIGVAGGDLSLQTLVDMINAQDFDGMGYAFLVNGNGKILVHPDQRVVMKTLAELYPNDNLSISRDLQDVTLDGVERILTFVPVRGLPSVDWHIGVLVDRNEAYSALSEFRASALVAVLVSVVFIILLLGLLIRVLMRPLTAMGQAMANIAEGEGDLTRRLAVDSRDEFGELASAFNRFVERIHASISEVSSATAQVNAVAAQVLSASNSSMANSDEQALRTNSVAAAINELGAAAQEIASNAAHASHQASDARQQADGGREVVEQNIRAMQQLSEKISDSCVRIEALSQKTVNINHILEVIRGISEQTNLLALNAAIEAARAGEAGRGFAVVADEVRNLAHRTQVSAEEIHQMIAELQVDAGDSVNAMTESQQESEHSVSIANQAGERLVSVTGRIGEIDAMNQSVAAATEEQTNVIESLNVDITEINTLNQQGVDNLQSTLQACSELDRQTTRLKQLVDSFRI
ncbi:methyl-accepting chemotaxis protein [Halopseudomonas xiamenensis]|uniref:methyl-accepting chemotaxis protein n=1 Tax=Halopseudomonas xiamenensis TaxID=157792 RepID=UPI0016288A55|nr:methyl-accepting chemotaxis protein [Halopseudomonas xiamenensis]